MATPAMVRGEEPRDLVSGFTAGFRDAGSARISSERVAERLGVNKDRLAKLTRLHRNTLRTNPSSDVLQERLREIVKVIAAARELTRDDDEAVYWFMNEPIRDYRGMTAAELVSDGRIDAVLAYIEDLHNGAAG